MLHFVMTTDQWPMNVFEFFSHFLMIAQNEIKGKVHRGQGNANPGEQGFLTKYQDTRCSLGCSSETTWHGRGVATSNSRTIMLILQGRPSKIRCTIETNSGAMKQSRLLGMQEIPHKSQRVLKYSFCRHQGLLCSVWRQSASYLSLPSLSV